MNNPIEITQDVLNGMIGIGGMAINQDNQDFYDEFNERLKAALDLHSVSQQSEMLVEFLIEFLIELNNKGLINNYDFDYEKEAKEYVLMKNKQTK